MTRRSLCEVPWCTNSSEKYKDQEYICSVHWREVPTKFRRAFNEACVNKEWEKAQRAWRKIRKFAIERAGGIG